MEAVLHVKNLAYCKIEIEDANMPPSYNILDHLTIQEGFGIAVPTLTLYLFDQTGTLQNEMNLMQGTKCTLSIARNSDSDNIIKRVFSLWGMKRGITDGGPHLEVVFILDVPKWTAGVYCENFRTTSAGALSQVASKAGLSYSGPSSTDDSMNWLNINTTRASFSEDVAMRGYAGPSSCMARVLTMDKELRYKDIFEQMQKQETATLLLNADKEGPNPYPVKETQESSMSSIMAHWFNFGQIQHEHSLDGGGQQKTEKIKAPVLGDSFPISDRVKGLMSDAVAARVTYTGFDTGTEPNPQSNHHQYYERAFYQNLRGLGLFTEKVRTLVPVLTDIYSLDCVQYTQKDPVGHQMVPSRALNGKYLVAGKTVRIKNGHNYNEILDLVRPYVSNPGKSAAVSGKPTKKQVPANEGQFDLATPQAQNIPSAPPPAPSNPSIPDAPTSEVESATNLMSALDAYNTTNPAIPTTPLPGPGAMSAGSPPALNQAKLRNAIADVRKVSKDFADVVDASKAGFTPEDHHTIKRIAASAVQTSANSTIDALKQHAAETGKPASGPEGLYDSIQKDIAVQVERPVMDRFSGKGREAKETKFESIVSAATAATVSVGDFVGDLQNGGVFSEDFNERGLETPTETGRRVVDALERQDKLGGNFVFPASKFGLGADDVAIGPKQVADFLLDYAEERKDPQQFLKDKGADAYQAAFGERPPEDAKEAIDQLGKAAEKVKGQYGDNEVIVDGANAVQKIAEISNNRNLQTIADSDASKARRIRAAQEELSLKDPTVTVKTSGLQVSGTVNADEASKMLSRRSGDTDYSEVIDFKFGENGVSPLVEKVVDSQRDGRFTQAEIIETTREAVSWATYTRMGSNKAKKEGTEEEGNYWEFPRNAPFEVMEEGEGEAHDLSDAPSDF